MMAWALLAEDCLSFEGILDPVRVGDFGIVTFPMAVQT